MLKDNFKKARELKGLTTYQLAEKLNISQSAVARFESGSLKPSYDILMLSSKILEVSLDELTAE